ncbi:MAG: hypothetical protein IKE55_11835, partial [Kiritimatiellae bacterium]|nr:hypothetical protein [Kiritimatiellia bacterium]
GVAGGGTLGFFPADQLVGRPAAFRRAIARAAVVAARRDTVVTVGIRPTYPATCFGYVDPERGTFVEKPDARRAAQYLRKGFLWNAGMFIARSDVFRAAFAEHAPSLLPLASARTAHSLRRVYEPLPRISFDYAVMEKLPRVEVVKGDFGWDDVGGYAAFDRYYPHDPRGNVKDGPCKVVESDGNICVAKSASISLLGVKNLVVVTTPDAVLVADKSRLSEMKLLFK